MNSFYTDIPITLVLHFPLGDRLVPGKEAILFDVGEFLVGVICQVRCSKFEDRDFKSGSLAWRDLVFTSRGEKRFFRNYASPTMK